MTVSEAAAAIGCSERLAYKLIAAGLLGARRVGFGRGKLVVDPPDLAAYLAGSRVEPAPDVRPARTATVVVPDVLGEWRRRKRRA